jgi:hypothetical protein
MTDHDTEQLRRIVAADPLPTGSPDLAALRSSGQRVLHRRRAVAGFAAVAAVAAIAAPTYLVASTLGSDGDTDGQVADGAAAATGAPDRLCGEIMCFNAGKPGAAEERQVVGEPWVLTDFGSGVEEVIYHARDVGTDGVVAGTRIDGELHPAAWALNPGAGFESPDGDPVRFWSEWHPLGDPDSPDFLVLGFVPGAPDRITWSTPDGDGGPVDGMSTAVVDGFTVFYLTPPMPDGITKPTYEKQGDSMLIDPGQGTFPPDLTIHTSDGWSCSLADCGAVG